MARARLISRTLGTSRCYAELGTRAGELGEFAQALYPMLIVFADDHGREHGDAFTIKHAVWPTSKRSEAEFALALNAMIMARLITVYEVDGAIYFQIRDFEQHQQGLHKRRASKFPDPIPGNSGNVQETPDKSGKFTVAHARGNDTETNRTRTSDPTDHSDRPPVARRGRPRRVTAEPSANGGGSFERFWAAYPRKVAKQAALVEWQRLKPTDTQLADMLAAIAVQAQSEQWQKDGGQFIPHPRKWLHQGQWADEPIVVGLPVAPPEPERFPPASDCRHDPPCTSSRMHATALALGRTG